MISRIQNTLGKQVDNSPLVLFRMFYGFLIAAESFGAIMTGWVNETFVEPEFTFNFIGLDWLQILNGEGAYFYFAVMGTMGFLVMLGLFYRPASFIFFVMWTASYLAQKSHYNNHYYLLVLMSAVMTLMPAHRNRSLDAKFGFVARENTCAQAFHLFFIFQIIIVYVVASLNKIHMDWLMARPISIWFQMKANYWLIGPLLQEKWLQYFVAWGGVLYDGTIAFLLLHPKTRKIAFGLSLFFNLFNSAVFQIGIFPYLMIALTVFFFPPETIRKIFFKKKDIIVPKAGEFPKAWTWAFIIYFIIQLAMPLRPHLYRGDSHFTEEAHRLSWRMMLRVKRGLARFEVEEEDGTRTRIRLGDYMSVNQRSSISGKPDMIWQFAQRLKKEYAEEGKSVKVFVTANISLNGHPRKPLIDPNIDLASVPWDRWKHSEWILTNEDND